MHPDTLGSSDTIVAIATPPGRSAIGMVRLSGPDSLRFCQKIFRTRSAGWPRPQQASTGELVDPNSLETIDQAVVCYFKAPHSYSGEDIVEFNCHGSPIVLQMVVRSLVALGARLARPGEFTLRAFIHGKIDLPQAEGVRDLIDAQTEYQSKIALQQIQGSLSKEIEPCKVSLLDLIVRMETAVEFADERLVDLENTRIGETIQGIIRQFKRLVDSFQFGRVVREGLDLAILGKPNVGKSSIFNGLLRKDRAIVTEMPGTTRDTVAEATTFEGVPVRLIDTAGVRITSDPVELIGIERTRRATADADLVLLVFDSSCPFDDQDFELIDVTSSTRRLMALNKIDLPTHGQFQARVPQQTLSLMHKISAKSGAGLAELKGAILQTVFSRTELSGEDAILTNVRHSQILESAIIELEKATEAVLSGMSEEVTLSHLNQTLTWLGELTGETTVEDILDRIFATFCIGK